jgi:signal peptidase I
MSSTTLIALDSQDQFSSETGSDVTANAPQTRRRPWRFVGSVLIFIVALVILWPAQFGGITGLTVVNGHSMEPTYHTGDLVVSLRLPSYQNGDIVSYLVPKGQPGAGGRVIHRIFSIDNSSGSTAYTTKGDNNPSVDPWHFGNGDVLGMALFSIPAMGSVLGGASNPIVIGLVAGILVMLLVLRIGSAPKKRRHRGAP